MGANPSGTPFATVLIADQSPASRRTCRKMVAAAFGSKADIREASTLHAVRVLLRELRPALIIASDEIAGGDADALIGAIRDNGADGRIVLISRHPRAPATQPPGAPGAVHIVPRALAGEMLPPLIAPLGESAGASPAGSHRHAERCDDDIVPFRVAERRIIETAIQRAGGNIGKAARALEISPSTIYRKIQIWHA